jgi:NAD(P)-dependent dehydrogenase (short-subunit alcohol dehydrogenase family)
MKLAGRCAIISGASRGLGFEVARQFVLEGANVMLCARGAVELSRAQEELQALAGTRTKVMALAADVSLPADMEDVATTTIAEFGKVDALIANAGIYGPKGPIEEVNWQEWSDAIDINLKGTVLQCRAIIPHFKLNRAGKIIILSGGGATKPMPYLSAYAASKAGVVRFAETLAEELKGFGIDVNTVAPGALNTRLLDEVLAAGPAKVGKEFYEQSLKQQQKGGTPLEVGARLCPFLASQHSDGISGRLISAVWDPWEKFPEFLQALQTSDIYTLRRIVPEDRGVVWGEA